jgi:hypothetical protein
MLRFRRPLVIPIPLVEDIVRLFKLVQDTNSTLC